MLARTLRELAAPALARPKAGLVAGRRSARSASFPHLWPTGCVNVPFLRDRRESRPARVPETRRFASFGTGKSNPYRNDSKNGRSRHALLTCKGCIRRRL